MSISVIGCRDVLKASKKTRFYPACQNEIHIIFENRRGMWTIVPRKKELRKGRVLKINSECGLTKKEFLDLF